MKGLDPYLYECLAATFHQDYPVTRLEFHFCISSRDDAAYGIVEDVVKDFPHHDIRVFVEEEDPALLGDNASAPLLGPNPKIRNMSRGYREAKGDIVWIIDCNVWVGKGTCGRMVDKLCGFTNKGKGKKYKFVHHLPISVDVAGDAVDTRRRGLLRDHLDMLHTSTTSTFMGGIYHVADIAGGRLEEVFLSSSHAKMYTAINTVAVAPCILGKSNMFRRSHLNYLTSSASARVLSSPDPASSEASNARVVGIDHFSYNICEDHLIGDLLWRSSLPDESSIGNHGLVFGDLAVQPIASMSIAAYIARRVRWLRVRKFTVTLATLVEPGTENFLCSLYGAFGLTSLPWMLHTFNTPQTWSAFLTFWLLSVMCWAVVDWSVYLLLHSGRTIEAESFATVPPFVRPLSQLVKRPFVQWLAAWLAREALALPIWLFAFWGGVTVTWRDRKFWVGMDMKVHAIDDRGVKFTGGASNGHIAERCKTRTE